MTMRDPVERDPVGSVQGQDSLRVAFSGHRKLARGLEPGATESLEAQLASAIDALLPELGDLARDRGCSGVLWLSGLAEGADLVAAEAVLRAGPGFALRGVSPFPFEEFLAELPVIARARARACWDSSAAPEELGASVAGETRSQVQQAKRAGYVALGEHLLRGADLLVVVLDEGREDGGPGGTGWVWGRAGAAGVPRLRLRWSAAPPRGYLLSGDPGGPGLA